MSGDCAIVGPCKDLLAHWVHASGPDPLLHLGDGAKKDSIFIPKRQLFITSSNSHILPSRVERDRTWIKAKVFVISNLFVVLSARQLING